MIRDHLFKTVFLISILLIIAGSSMKALHKPGADIFMIATIITTIIYAIVGIYEVYHSTKIGRTEKIMWTVGFIFLSMITGIVYLVSGRQRILRSSPPLI